VRRAGTTTAARTRATPRLPASGISQSNGAFTQAFQQFTSGSNNNGGGTPHRPPTPTTTTTSPSGSCATAWVSNAAYTSGNEVSYNGDNWTANQWNYDEVPGGPRWRLEQRWCLLTKWLPNPGSC